MDPEQSNSSIQPKPLNELQEASFSAIIEQGDARYHEGKYLDSFNIYIKALSMELDPYQAITINIKLGKSSLKSGKYSEAHQYFSKALDLSVGLKGDNMLQIFRIKIDLGRVCYKQGKHQESAGYLESTLNVLIAQYPENYNEIVSCYSGLSDIQYAQDEFSKSLELLLKAQSIIQKNDGGVSIYKSATIDYMLGRVYKVLLKYPEAYHYTEKALKKKVELHGEDHLEVALCFHTLGHLSCDEKKYEEALEYYNRAFNIRVKFLGESHPLVSNSYECFGLIRKHQKRYDEALEYYSKVLAIRMKCLEENHPDIALVYRRVGSLLAAKEEFSQAIGQFSQALDMHSRFYGEDHFSVAKDYESIGNIFYFDLEDCLNAEQNLLKSLEIKIKWYGPKDPKVTTLYATLGTLYHEKKDYLKALPYFLKSLNNKAAASEMIDEEECSTRYNLSLLFRNKWSLSSAINSAKKAKKAYSKLFGKDHANIRDSDELIRVIEKRNDIVNLNNSYFF